MNFPHHRENALELLGCAPTRAAIEEALKTGKPLPSRRKPTSTAASSRRCGRRMNGRSISKPARLPRHRSCNREIGDAPARPLPRGARALSGLRVLDLTRIIAGPVAGRALAAHGADVMRISAPSLPFIDWLVKDTGRGKLSAYADIATADGRAALARLIKDADIFLQAFRPGALAARGFGAADVAALRPGIVYGSLSAYGDAGPWASRRGFDSLVQTATGFNVAEAQAAGVEARRNCPARRSITQPAICWHLARSWRASPGARRRQLAGARLACRDRPVDLASGPYRRRIFLPTSVARRCRGPA